jgi:hypothetical protein
MLRELKCINKRYQLNKTCHGFSPVIICRAFLKLSHKMIKYRIPRRTKKAHKKEIFARWNSYCNHPQENLSTDWYFKKTQHIRIFAVKNPANRRFYIKMNWQTLQLTEFKNR